MWPLGLLTNWPDNSLPFPWSMNRLYFVWKMLRTTHKLWSIHRNWWKHPVSNMSNQGDHFYIRCATILVKTVSEMMSWLKFLQQHTSFIGLLSNYCWGKEKSYVCDSDGVSGNTYRQPFVWNGSPCLLLSVSPAPPLCTASCSNL